MSRFLQHLFVVLIATLGLAESSLAQKALTWQEIRQWFEAANPTLRAGQIGIDESRAAEITAHLRPNPNLGLIVDQINPFNGGPSHSATGSLLTVAAVNYLHERRNKRELRLESAQKTTEIVVSVQADLERTLIFTQRMAFVQTLQAKVILGFAKENLAYYDHMLDVNRERYKAGSIAQVDLDRLELQRVQYESDLQIAEESLEIAARAQVFADVDSAYASVASTLTLLQPYKDRYLQQASRVRGTIAFSYERGAASLLDFLNAQAEYRSVQVNYLNLVGSYLDAANQLNLAAGREVIQ